MIESLGEHGVDPTDLVPALMTTHTVKNPEFDPLAKKKADIEAKRIPEEDEGDLNDPPPAYQQMATEHPNSLDNVQVDPASVPLPPPSPVSPPSQSSSAIPSREVPVDPIGDDDHTSNASSSGPPPSRPSQVQYPSLDEYVDDGDDGDIGQSLSARPASGTLAQGAEMLQQEKLKASGPAGEKQRDDHDMDPDKTPTKQPQHLGEEAEFVETAAMPSLPGVSTSLSNTDETVTLDIRWTVVSCSPVARHTSDFQLCDLFLVLIADSVYDSRSRAFLEHIAVALGFGWLDAVRFENRVTNALDIEEAIEKTEQKDVIEGRRKAALKKRYAMMGLAAVGEGLLLCVTIQANELRWWPRHRSLCGSARACHWSWHWRCSRDDWYHRYYKLPGRRRRGSHHHYWRCRHWRKHRRQGHVEKDKRSPPVRVQATSQQ